MWTYNYNNELYHYGIKGMKWGVRRFQNSDGSLTPAGKKKISKKYRRLANKASNEAARSHNRRYLSSYNKAADEMNKGGIEKFNTQQRKKYGDNFAKRDGYMDDYNKMFSNTVAKYYDQSLNDFYKSDKNFKKAELLVEKYNMTKWDDLARSNQEVIDELRRNLEEYD